MANKIDTDGAPHQSSSLTLMGVGDSSTDGASLQADEGIMMMSMKPI